MSDNFNACLAFTLRGDVEGGWSDDARDPGGQTFAGITLTNFRLWRSDPFATAGDLRKIVRAEIEAFYRTGYWQPLHAGALPAGVDLSCFDMAVNAGVRRSAMILQAVLGVDADGWVGPRTTDAAIAAMHLARDPLIDQIAAAQQRFYAGLPGYRNFGRGWSARVVNRTVAARRLAGLPETRIA